MARERGVKGFTKLGKFEIAERLGIELPKPCNRYLRIIIFIVRPKSGKMNFRKVRPVEVLNPVGTITIYSRVNKAAKALKKDTMQNYTMVAFGKARIVDIETPIEILNDDGTTTTYSDINKAAEMLKLHTMEIYTMVFNGKAKFMNANINKTNMVSNGEVRMRGRSMLV